MAFSTRLRDIPGEIGHSLAQLLRDDRVVAEKCPSKSGWRSILASTSCGTL
jgi:hypothetical protein